MSRIRIFTNQLGLKALSVESEDLYSFRIMKTTERELMNFQRNLWHSRKNVPNEYIEVGSLVETNQVTFRFLRKGSTAIELPMPDNIDELGFNF